MKDTANKGAIHDRVPTESSELLYRYRRRVNELRSRVYVLSRILQIIGNDIDEWMVLGMMDESQYSTLYDLVKIAFDHFDPEDVEILHEKKGPDLDDETAEPL